MVSGFECVACHDTQCTYTGVAEFKPACLVEITPDKVWQKLEFLLSGAANTQYPNRALRSERMSDSTSVTSPHNYRTERGSAGC
jgi:hypothetical protein